MTLAEQIAKLESARKEKQSRMDEVVKKSMEESRGLDDAEGQEFDDLDTEIKRIDQDIDRMKKLQALQARSAASAEDDAAQKSSASAVPGMPQIQLKKQEKKLEPGVGFARIARVKALAKLDNESPRFLSKELYGSESQTTRFFEKAAVPAGNTTDEDSNGEGWAGPLVGEETSVFADFVEFLRPMTILGKFGMNGIPALRRVPFRTALVGQTSGGDGYWVGEGNAKPLTKFDFNRRSLEPLKVANIAVATMELIRDSSPSADLIIRDQLAAALRERLDLDFIDPAKAVSAGVSPASILNAPTAITSSGDDADAVRADLRELFNAFIAANNAPTGGVFVMPATVALALSLMQNPLGQPEFTGISMGGGTLSGIPVIVSEYVPTDSTGSVVALINASDIYLADEGGVSVDMSMEASLQMDDAPDNPSDASTVMVSLWQRNMVGFRAERTINWMARRDSAAAYLSGVNWGAPAS